MKKSPGRKMKRQQQREEARKLKQRIKAFAGAKKRHEEKDG